MYRLGVKKEILAISAAVLCSAILSALDREIPLTPGDMPPRAISAWELRGAVLERGWRGGWDIVIGPPAAAADLSGVSGSQPVQLDFEWASDSPPQPWAVASGTGVGLGPGRIGSSSGRFAGRLSALTFLPAASSVLSPGRELRDFSIEFWINPSTTENGESVFDWKARRWAGGGYKAQSISCSFSGGRLAWSLDNVFSTPTGKDHRLAFQGRRIVVPRTWSHHRLRFDFSTGLVEYLVDGLPEAIAYATDTGRDGGAVLIPVVGLKGSLSVGGGYAGLLDAFRIAEEAAEGAALSLYDPSGAEAWSPVVDTGSPGTALLSLSAVWQAEADTDIEFLLRSGESYADWTPSWPEWHRVVPGQALGVPLKGRYVQARACLFTDGPAAVSPRLSRLALTVREDLPPPPPTRVLAAGGDGVVTLNWSPVPEADVGGYLVYYGFAPGEYFGSDAAQGRSPVDAGKATSLTLTGLTNGRLYYIAISAYDTPVEGDDARKREGELSAETKARPLRPTR